MFKLKSLDSILTFYHGCYLYNFFSLHHCKALNSLICADVPLRNYSYLAWRHLTVVHMVMQWSVLVGLKPISVALTLLVSFDLEESSLK